MRNPLDTVCYVLKMKQITVLSQTPGTLAFFPPLPS